jgi:hypothetical protein
MCPAACLNSHRPLASEHAAVMCDMMMDTGIKAAFLQDRIFDPLDKIAEYQQPNTIG